jgi:hypothetical protein
MNTASLRFGENDASAHEPNATHLLPFALLSAGSTTRAAQWLGISVVVGRTVCELQFPVDMVNLLHGIDKDKGVFDADETASLCTVEAMIASALQVDGLTFGYRNTADHGYRTHIFERHRYWLSRQVNHPTGLL